MKEGLVGQGRADVNPVQVPPYPSDGALRPHRDPLPQVQRGGGVDGLRDGGGDGEHGAPLNPLLRRLPRGELGGQHQRRLSPPDDVEAAGRRLGDSFYRPVQAGRRAGRGGRLAGERAYGAQDEPGRFAVPGRSRRDRSQKFDGDGSCGLGAHQTRPGVPLGVADPHDGRVVGGPGRAPCVPKPIGGARLQGDAPILPQGFPRECRQPAPVVEDVADDPAGGLRGHPGPLHSGPLRRKRRWSEAQGAVRPQRRQGRVGLEGFHDGDLAAAQDEGIAVVWGWLGKMGQAALSHQL